MQKCKKNIYRIFFFFLWPLFLTTTQDKTQRHTSSYPKHHQTLIHSALYLQKWPMQNALLHQKPKKINKKFTIEKITKMMHKYHSPAMDLEYGVNTSCHRCHQKQSQNQSQHPHEMLLSVFLCACVFVAWIIMMISLFCTKRHCIQLLLQENEMQVLLPLLHPLLLLMCLCWTQRPIRVSYALPLFDSSNRNAHTTIHTINDKKEKQRTRTRTRTMWRWWWQWLIYAHIFHVLHCFPLCNYV